MAPPFSPTNTPANPDLSKIMSIPLTSSDNISFLVEIRHHHQTKEAEKGVCRNGTATLAPSSNSSHTPSLSGEPVSERQLLACKICDIVKAVDGADKVGTSSGLNRQVRWTKTVTPGLYSPSFTHLDSLTDGKSRNSANAMEAAKKAANLVCLSPTISRGLITIENCRRL
ncbi:hypothetical protein EI94DRAFT_1742259 [Lactarius quietus]|nr:hypothetical protein EI94DRAFT_1742259 [Lactarius quietus]